MKFDNMTAWDLFEEITTAYFKKQMYFIQDDGTVYSRLSNSYLNKDDALNEFLVLFDVIV